MTLRPTQVPWVGSLGPNMVIPTSFHSHTGCLSKGTFSENITLQQAWVFVPQTMGTHTECIPPDISCWLSVPAQQHVSGPFLFCSRRSWELSHFVFYNWMVLAMASGKRTALRKSRWHKWILYPFMLRPLLNCQQRKDSLEGAVHQPVGEKSTN